MVNQSRLKTTFERGVDKFFLNARRITFTFAFAFYFGLLTETYDSKTHNKQYNKGLKQIEIIQDINNN